MSGAHKKNCFQAAQRLAVCSYKEKKINLKAGKDPVPADVTDMDNTTSERE